MEAEAEAAALNAELSTHNASIDNVRNKFSRQLTRLEKKQQSVKESRTEWETEKSSIEKEKTAHEAVVQAHSEDLLTMDQLLQDIQSELSMAKNFEDIISQQFNDSGLADREDVGAFDNEVLKCEAAVDEANRNVQSADAAIQSLQEEISSIGVRLPILEAEKKAAASKRDFKAAGKASKEIKDSLARKEQCEAELAGEAMSRSEDAKEELSKASALLDEKKSIAAAKGREYSKEQMAMLKSKICDLKSILKEFGADSDSVSVASVGAFVIESQIRVLEARGEALGAKYGGWDDTADSDVIEDDTVQSAPTLDSVDVEITSEILKQYSALKEEISKLEAAIDKAAEEEDYETAGELEDKMESVRARIEALGISPDALEEAIASGLDKNDVEQEQDAPIQEAADIDESHSQDDDDRDVVSTEADATKAEENEAINEIEDEKKMSDDTLSKVESAVQDEGSVHSAERDSV